MKTAISKRGALAFGIALTLAASATVAETLSMNGAEPGGSADASPPANRALTDLAKLARAKVDDSVILAYARNSGAANHLGADDIVYLRNSGVSTPVLTALLDQSQKRNQSTAVAPAATPAAKPAGAAAPTASAPRTYVMAPPADTASSGSSVYVIPYETGGSQPWYYYWYYYNYYPGYSYYPWFGTVYYTGYHHHHPGYGFYPGHGYHPGFGHRPGGFHPGNHPAFHSSFRGGPAGVRSSFGRPMHGHR